MCWSASVSLCMYHSGGVCVCVCLSVIISLYGWGYFCVRRYGIWVLWIFFFMLSWLFQHDYLDTCFECLISMCFVFAPVQRNWACFTWKGPLEIHSSSSSGMAQKICPNAENTISIKKASEGMHIMLLDYQLKFRCFFCQFPKAAIPTTLFYGT